jgi:pSer/pThr/pTyr-binding forkhead associated (FHA) protein
MPEGWTLVDEGSRNGSYVNGQRMSGEHPLREGDVLRFGDTVVLFRAPLTDEEAVAVQPGQVTSLGQRSTHWAGPSEPDPGR